ncbi:hypothetical protein QYM36_018650 [Artemia franciscana]|uniref:Uncharacterized protein n=1 Tax=Artemia franciscana TaxID=6661 RepID=A0AA88L063_ARTSF|nr:hypothetical protein QYM36_018650 [Artemia franciscana]
MSRLQKYRSDMTKPIKMDIVSKPSLPSEPQPNGPLASRQDPTAVNQNPSACAVPVNQNHGPGVAEPFSPKASTQEYECLFEKLPKSLLTTINKPNTDFVAKEMAKNLKQVYENIGKFGALSSSRHLALAANTSQQEAQKFLERNESYTLHRRAVRPKHFRKTIALYSFEIAQADLMTLEILAPNQAYLQNTPYISDFMYGKNESKQKKLRNQLQAGQSARVLGCKGIFEKEQFNFRTEIFRIASVQSTDPIAFKLVDLSDEPVLGCFYQSELQKVQEPDEYVKDKVLNVENIKKDKDYFFKFFQFVGDTKDPSKRLDTKITLPKNKQYKTILEIIKDMNNLAYTGKDSANFQYNKQYDPVYILGLKVGESCYLSDGLREVLGYKENIIEPEPDNNFHQTYGIEGPLVPGLYNQWNSIFVYMNIVQRSGIGNTSAPILRILPRKMANEEVISYSFQPLIYLDISRKNIEIVHFSFRTEKSNIIPINRGLISLTVEFRKDD